MQDAATIRSNYLLLYPVLPTVVPVAATTVTDLTTTTSRGYLKSLSTLRTGTGSSNRLGEFNYSRVASTLASSGYRVELRQCSRRSGTRNVMAASRSRSADGGEEDM